MLNYKFLYKGFPSSDWSIHNFLLTHVTRASKTYAGKSKSDAKVAKQDLAFKGQQKLLSACITVRTESHKIFKF